MKTSRIGRLERVLLSAIEQNECITVLGADCTVRIAENVLVDGVHVGALNESRVNVFDEMLVGAEVITAVDYPEGREAGDWALYILSTVGTHYLVTIHRPTLYSHARDETVFAVPCCNERTYDAATGTFSEISGMLAFESGRDDECEEMLAAEIEEALYRLDLEPVPDPDIWGGILP